MSIKEKIKKEIQNLVNALGIKNNEIVKIEITLDRKAKRNEWNGYDEVRVLFSWRTNGGYSTVSALTKSYNAQPVHNLIFDREVHFDSESAKSQIEVAMKRLGDAFQHIREDSAVSNLCRVLNTDEYVIHQILIQPNAHTFVFSFGNKNRDFVLIKQTDATWFKSKSYQFEVHVNGYDDNFYYSPAEYGKELGLDATAGAITQAITRVREQFSVL